MGENDFKIVSIYISRYAKSHFASAQPCRNVIPGAFPGSANQSQPFPPGGATEKKTTILQETV
jgi:hypothetical protein